MSEKSILKLIPLASVRENPVALRSVNRQSEKYQELVDSIRRNGILNAILVREIKDPESGNMLYGLIDGLHRYSASQDAGLTEIPAQIRSMEDAAVLEAQIIANIQKIETLPSQYSTQLMRILIQNPLMTSAELATRLAKSPTWLNDRLSLVKLPEKIATLVDEGRINLSNAYALAKLAAVAIEEVPNFVDRAMTQSPAEFVPTCTARIKEIRDLKRQGRDTAPQEFKPQAHLRKLSELKEEIEKPNVGPILVRELKIQSPHEAFALGVKWAMYQDPASIEAAKQKEADRVRNLEADKEKRKAEKQRMKEEEASKVAAAVSA